MKNNVSIHEKFEIFLRIVTFTLKSLFLKLHVNMSQYISV